MSEKNYLNIVGTIFAIVAVVHLSRIVFDWPVIIGTWAVPMWVSWLGLVVTTALSFFGFKLARE